MPIHMYDCEILPLIREVLAKEADMTSEQALISFCDRRLEMVRTSDVKTFERWTKQANELASEKGLTH